MKRFCISLLSLVLHVSLVSAAPPLAPPLLSDPGPTEVELADPTLANTPEKRHQLHYLVTCALPKSIILYTQQGTARFTFPGQMGLAPGWLKHPMTPAEERWVSACMLALVNYFGRHVEVSMRAEPSP